MDSVPEGILLYLRGRLRNGRPLRHRLPIFAEIFPSEDIKRKSISLFKEDLAPPASQGYSAEPLYYSLLLFKINEAGRVLI